MVCNSNDQPELELRHLQALFAQRVDGVLLATSDSYAARHTPMHDGTPVVFIDCTPLNASVNCVVTDNFDAAYRAMRYLIELGHQRIAVISGRVVHSTSLHRVEGCRKAMQEANLPTIEKSMQQGDSHIESGYRIGLSLLQSLEPPTAIFTMNNRMALRVSMLSFDDSDWASVLTPSLTTIAQPSYEIGKASVELLRHTIDSALQQIDVAPREVLLKSTLCIRESTGPAAK
jgi:LacI family transcriptional regulator